MLKQIGSFTLFIGRVFSNFERLDTYRARFFDEGKLIGIDSLFIVSIISFFLGAVTSYQTAVNFEASALVPAYLIGTSVRDIIVLEMAPTVTCIVLAGKIGSNIAGTLGSMRVSEQIEALEVMGINSASYLTLPRVAAGIYLFPALVVFSLFWNFLGAYLATFFTVQLGPAELLLGIRNGFNGFVFFFALLKSLVFGFLIITISSYIGYNTTGGALGVGKSGTRAVTLSCIAVLTADFVLAQLFLS